LKTYFLTPWSTYATYCNGLNNFGRGPLRHHFCEVWSKSNEGFQRRRCLSKMLMDDGQRPVTIAHPEHFVLRWAKKEQQHNILVNEIFQVLILGPLWVASNDMAAIFWQHSLYLCSLLMGQCNLIDQKYHFGYPVTHLLTYMVLR